MSQQEKKNIFDVKVSFDISQTPVLEIILENNILEVRSVQFEFFFATKLLNFSQI